MPIFWGDSRRESERKPFRKLDNSAPKREPVRELGEAERIERPELKVKTPFGSRPESRK
jgi:hypothetical protein